MPDFIGKLNKEVIFTDKKSIFLKNLNKIHFVEKKLKNKFFWKWPKLNLSLGILLFCSYNFGKSQAHVSYELVSYK